MPRSLVIAFVTLSGSACSWGNLCSLQDGDARAFCLPRPNPCEALEACGSWGEPPVRTGICTPDNSSRRCECVAGYRKKDPSDVVSPCDVDVCDLDTTHCGLGTCTHRSSFQIDRQMDYAGDAYCHCPPGSTNETPGNALSPCVDTNECMNAPCGEHEDCINKTDDFDCVCSCGYESRDGGPCVAVCDENTCGTYTYAEGPAVGLTVPLGECQWPRPQLDGGCSTFSCACGWEESEAPRPALGDACEDPCDTPGFCGLGTCVLGYMDPPSRVNGIECRCNEGARHVGGISPVVLDGGQIGCPTDLRYGYYEPDGGPPYCALPSSPCTN